MLIEKHLLSNKTNADRERYVERQPYGNYDSCARPCSQQHSSADRGDTEKLTDQHLINQMELAPSGAPSL